MFAYRPSEGERPFVIDCVLISLGSAIVTLIACAVSPAKPIPALLMRKETNSSRKMLTQDRDDLPLHT